MPAQITLLPELLLLVALLWLGGGLVVEAGAWWAVRVGRVAAPPCFSAEPAGPGPSGLVRIAFLGDVQRGVADVVRPLAAALAARPADLLVSSGDFVAHGEAPYYGTLLDAFAHAGIETPIRVVPGNHDLFPRRVRDPAAGYELFSARFGPPSWVVRLGVLAVVGIDDAVPRAYEAWSVWLEETLAATPGPWIAVCHRPPRRVDLPDAPPDTDLAGLVATLERRPPLLVVCGHLHEAYDREVNGVRYVVNAHGGDVHGLALTRGPFELHRVEVGPDGGFRLDVERHPRRPWLRVYVRQLAVRCWWSRRRGGGRLLTLPAGILLSAIGLRAPLR